MKPLTLPQKYITWLSTEPNEVRYQLRLGHYIIDTCHVLRVEQKCNIGEVGPDNTDHLFLCLQSSNRKIQVMQT
jgi:hypothetical protein